MFRRAVVFCVLAASFFAVVANVEACHRCRARRGYGVSGCGYQCHGKGSAGYRIVRVYRTVKVPVQTCSTCCATVVDPCNPCCTTTVPVQTCTTTYVTQRVLVHSQVVPRGAIYGNYVDGTRRQVGGYGAGYGSPYRAGYGMGGGYPMGGYGANIATDSYLANYKVIGQDESDEAKSVGIAF